MLVFVEAFWRAHRQTKTEGIPSLYPEIVLSEGHQVLLDALLEGNYSWSVMERPCWIPTYIETFDVEGIGSLVVTRSFSLRLNEYFMSGSKLSLTLVVLGEEVSLNLIG